eukprot:366390-Chlamydomonas_euryale.AAC.15
MATLAEENAKHSVVYEDSTSEIKDDVVQLIGCFVGDKGKIASGAGVGAAGWRGGGQRGWQQPGTATALVPCTNTCRSVQGGGGGTWAAGGKGLRLSTEAAAVLPLSSFDRSG